MNILVIGTGMYVCGRGTNGYGTLLPAIYEWKRRYGIIGDVYIAGSHFEGIKILKEKVSELNKLFGFEILPRYFPEKDVLNHEAYKKAVQEIRKPACAIIVVPDNLHKKVAEDTIKNSLHTFVVKPLAPTIQEVFELVELQRKNNVYCAVEFHKRFDRSNIKLRDTIIRGDIGDPLYFVVEYSQRKSIPSERFKTWVEATNIFQYLGIHYVDIIYFSTRAKPQRVMAVGQKNWLLQKGINTYDSIQVIVEWEMPNGNKFTASFFTNWIDPENTSAMSDQKIKVIGTRGRYEADQKMRGIYIVTDEKGIEEPNPDFCLMYGIKEGEISFHGYGIDSVLQFLKDVRDIEAGIIKIDVLEGKRPTFRDAIIPTIVIEAANRSLAEDGKWIQTK
ncbi:MAG TPA: Gfo/Idh/MocA family protein [Candidatus Wujingus californicus]|uniref:Gfo/Idh/MocA family protein n=1 Tax=Candidatus Wujingus californicus TaxID=3367618 RepID=UPI004029F966